MYEKNKRQINFNLPYKFGHFWRKLNFLGAQNAPFRRLWRPNAIWNFTPTIFLSSLHIFYVKMATSEGGGRVCIYLVVTGPRAIFWMIVCTYIWRLSDLILININSVIQDISSINHSNFSHLLLHTGRCCVLTICWPLHKWVGLLSPVPSISKQG